MLSRLFFFKREFNSVKNPNSVWLSNITYVQTQEGWLYVATIMDLCTRKIIGWCLDESIHQMLVNVESFFHTFKTEFIYHENFPTREEGKTKILEIEEFFMQDAAYSLIPRVRFRLYTSINGDPRTRLILLDLNRPICFVPKTSANNILS